MDAAQMLHKMCHQVLSNVDVKAICKSRGFSAQEAASRALFENFYLSDIGVPAAMALLTREEVVLLHLLRWLDDAVDVSFFARIYDEDGVSSRRYYTFTQRYKDVFKAVRTSLVRRGLLLLAEGDESTGDTKMERWRFRFPRQFERFLPPIVQHPKAFQVKAIARPGVRRQKLLEVVRGKRSSPLKADPQYDLKLVKGDLRMGKEAFRAARLREWQRACWEAAVSLPQRRRGEPQLSVSPAEATIYVQEQLGEKEWLRPGQLSVPLKVFCGVSLSGDQVCAAGWEWGCLARHEVDGLDYYRLPGTEAGDGVDPQTYLSAADAEPLAVDLEAVPYESLESLAQICDLRAAPKEGRADRGAASSLLARPNLVKMGHAPAATWHLPLTQWLRDNVPAFREALETVTQRWGKLVLHQGLLIARVEDLSLQVQLERAFAGSESVLFLPNGYLAFARQELASVARAVEKLGHVIKTVQRG
jgi:hypothetical protein